jgi:ferredoxin
MRVVVKLETCQGYANCVVEAPDLFDLDDGTGKAVVLVDEFETALAGDAQRAVDNCPVSAITIVD